MHLLQVRRSVFGHHLHLRGAGEIVDIAEIVYAEAVELVVCDWEVEAEGDFLLLFGEEGVVGEGGDCGVFT